MEVEEEGGKREAELGVMSMKMSVNFTSVLRMGGVNPCPNKSLRTRW